MVFVGFRPVLVFLCVALFCFVINAEGVANTPSTLVGKTYKVRASYYGGGEDDFDGKITASCTVFDSYEKTAAHKTLPLGTLVALKNPKNGRSEEVTITDRGPYIEGRDIDVAYHGVGVPLSIANNTVLFMEVLYVPVRPVMGVRVLKKKECNVF